MVDEALARWSGKAYLGVPGPFAEREREWLAELRLCAVELHARLVLQLGGHQDLIPELAERHPLRESLYEPLMLTLHRSGRTSEALETYFTAQRVLRGELGVEPRASMRELHQEIFTGASGELAEEAARAPSALSVVPPSVRKVIELGVSLRSREDEVARLDALVADVLVGRGRTLLVEDEPGIGKSELLAASLSAAERRGCQLAADRLLTFVDDVSTRGPLAMVLDDLHWADEASVLIWQRPPASCRCCWWRRAAPDTDGPALPSSGKACRPAEVRSAGWSG